jgi:hypothetical protein
LGNPSLPSASSTAVVRRAFSDAAAAAVAARVCTFTITAARSGVTLASAVPDVTMLGVPGKEEGACAPAADWDISGIAAANRAIAACRTVSITPTSMFE